MTQDQISAGDILAIVPANGTAVVATIHDRLLRRFDVVCSAHGRFYTCTYPRGITDRDRDQARQDTIGLCIVHAENCAVGSDRSGDRP